ncbi:uncharacterized protein CANTADRAFT_27956, partial [Suhomyces tanzawaensis NRRL Y-17324]
FATSSEDDFEIDLITLKKTPRNHSSPDSRLTSAFELLSYFESFKPRNVDHDYVKQSITKVKSHVAPPALPSVEEEDKGYLQFVELYRLELQQFLKFINQSYNAKISQFNQLTSLEVLNALYVFKNYYQKGKIPEVTKYNAASYNHMFGRFVTYLTKDKLFPQTLSNDLIPYVNDLKILQSLYKDGVGNFVEELNSLSTEFDFDRIETCSQLLDEINKTLDQFTDFLNRNQQDNEFKVDSTFFRILIQINRYKSLKKVLDSHPDVAVRHLRTILNDPDSIKINLGIKQSSGITSEIQNSLNVAAPYYQVLRCIEDIEISDYDSFLKTAPSLYEWAKSDDKKIIQGASFRVLQVCLSLFNSGLVSEGESSHILNYLTSGNTFGKHNLIEVVPGNTLLNYELTIFKYSGLFDSLDILKLVRAHSGGSFATKSTTEIVKSLETYVSSNTLKFVAEELVLVDNALHWFVYYVPWSDFAIFDQMIENRKWIQKLAEQNLQTAQKFNNLSSKDALDLFNNQQLAYATKPYVQIPDELKLEDFVNELLILQRDVLRMDFEAASSSQILKCLNEEIEKAFAGTSKYLDEESVFEYIRLMRRLDQLFDLNGDHTEVLDALLRSHSVFEQMELRIQEKTPEEYVQIPDELGLHKYIKELEILRDDELKKPFKNASVLEIQSLLSARIDDIYANLNESSTNSRMNSLNVIQFVKLSKRLASLFEINGGNANILDTLLYNQQVCDDLDSKLALQKNNEYVQIPDDLELHKFSDQLECFRDEVLKKPYRDYSPDEINSLLDKTIDDVIGKGLVIQGSNINSDTIYNYVKLSKRLTRLFNTNGGYTEVLDTLIHSQSVFKDFEKKIGNTLKKFEAKRFIKGNPLAYKQIPDDFHLEEYTPELIQLKNELGQEFKITPAQEIIDRLGQFIERESNLDKKVTWIQLQRNLRMLFNHNNNATFVLDNILVNSEVFLKFESNKAFNTLSNKESSLIGENSILINDSLEYIERFLKKLELIAKNGIWELTSDEFSELLKEFGRTVDKNAYDYPIYLNLVQELERFNSNLEYYPNFLQELYEIKLNNLDKRLTKQDVEVIYKAFIENFEYEDENTEHLEPISTFDMSEFRDVSKDAVKLSVPKYEVVDEAEAVALKSDYNDSEKLLSILSKSEEPLDLENNSVLGYHMENDPEERSELDIRDAVSIALSGRSSFKPKQVKQKKQKYDNQEFENSIASTSELSDSISSSLENFLQNAKKEQEMINEMKFRQSRAFDWNNSMSNSHRSLESHNFFDPLNSRPGRSNNFMEYLLLTLEGATIKSDKSSIGNLPELDIFKILNTFEKQDLDKFIKNFKRLQRSNWKVVGSKIEGDQKYLILSRPSISKSRIVLNRIKTLLATTGAILASLVALNLWFEETVPGEKLQPTVREQTRVEPVESHALGQEQPATTSSWRSLLW